MASFSFVPVLSEAPFAPAGAALPRISRRWRLATSRALSRAIAQLPDQIGEILVGEFLDRGMVALLDEGEFVLVGARSSVLRERPCLAPC